MIVKELKPKDLRGLAVLKMFINENKMFETQEVTILIDMDSDEHLYETLSFCKTESKSTDNNYIESDTDSFESDSGSEQSSFVNVQKTDVDSYSPNTRLPDPPVSASGYTLTRIAKNLKKFKENLTNRKKSNTEAPKIQTSNADTSRPTSLISDPSYENHLQTNPENVYENITFNNNNNNNNNKINEIKPSLQLTIPQKSDNNASDKSPQSFTYKSIFFGSSDKSKSQTSPDPNNQNNKKNYLSFKTKFRRSSDAQSKSSNRKSTLSTFYIDDLDTDKKDESATEAIVKPDNACDTRNESKSNKKSADDNETSPPAVNGKKHSPLNIIKATIPKISSSVRPNAPPPPPPSLIEDKNSAVKKEKRLNNTTSLYTECGLFKTDQKPESNGVPKNRSSLSWYAEIGLYQASNISTSSGASSTLSGSGTCSTSAAFSSPSTPVPTMSMFNQEPLYQFYDAAKLESVCRDIDENFDLDSDIYEEITDHHKNDTVHRPLRTLAMSLVNPKKGPSRTLWCEVPEVINSQILGSLTDKQRKVQEAKFEIITSEASYLNSLTVLESHFINHNCFQDENLINKNDKQNLFGNISPVKKCSQRFMADLENCWQDNIMLQGLCKIVKNHAETNFHVYVTYCEYQSQLVKTLEKLKKNENFKEITYQLQSQPECQSLSLDSFLLLPMQRITRLPLLLDAVLKNLDATNDEYESYVNTLRIVNNIVNQCNEGARNVERMEEMSIISSQIEFPLNIKEVPLLAVYEQNNRQSSKSQQRWLVRSGELTHLFWRVDDQLKLTFGRKIQKTTIHLFLFTDLLVVTKKKNTEDKYTVIDYCKRSLIEMTSGEAMSQSPIKDSSSKHTILLTLLENYENKTVEMLLCCKSESDSQRWLEACSKPSSANPNEVIYEGWDCPQVAAMYSYQPSQPDELSLQCGDIIYVHKKIDGWYHGERIRDGETGWFPGNHTVEIASAHVRARNLKQRYRLLELTGSYLNQQKKKSSQFWIS